MKSAIELADSKNECLVSNPVLPTSNTKVCNETNIKMGWKYEFAIYEPLKAHYKFAFETYFTKGYAVYIDEHLVM